MYTPGDYEERVPAYIIRKVVEKGAERADPSKLMLDSGHMYPVTFPFVPVATPLKKLAPPAQLNLDYLERL